MTRVRACCASFECVGMCKYDDANVLFYACWFAQRQMPWLSLQGSVRTAGCTLRRLCLPEVGKKYLLLNLRSPRDYVVRRRAVRSFVRPSAPVVCVR